MKKIFYLLTISLVAATSFGQSADSGKINDTVLLQAIEVTSIRASDKAPFTKTELNKTRIKEENMGYDLPFILDQTPSVVAGSDAGNGVGYTNMRIRGSDATRINVTLNGIPFNDAESQGTFFVNMPDIASSASSIQIQRGAGTSSNGPGSFGATINLSTNEVNKEKYLELNNSYGSFNTWKNTVKAGTGLIKDHFTIDARFSNITSDGYIDRATSDLKSYYASAAYLNKNTSLRFNFISGKEKTYQAWNGVPEGLLKTDRTYNSAGTEKPGTPYDNETDNYRQSHYQFFWNQKLKDAISFSAGTFLVRGKGYYENYKSGQKFKKYGLPDIVNGTDIIEKTDIILQRWLDNYFYGSIVSAQYAKGKTNIIAGGGYSRYDGRHFNKVIWADAGFPPDYSSYRLPAHKNDFNIYAKWMWSLGSGFNSFVDLQQRIVRYEISGFKDNPEIYINQHYSFFNPKIGLSYTTGKITAYASFSKASKEPNREDFETGKQQIPKPEKLYDWEGGFSYLKPTYQGSINFYFMNYKDQLVNTGMINDAGALTRTNAGKSYRAGIEIDGQYHPLKWFKLAGNASVSRNKIKRFTEYIYDENNQQTINHFENTDISYSPDFIAGCIISFVPVKNSEISFISKYVGKQYLDNTSDDNRMIKAYFVENARLSYTFNIRGFKDVKSFFQINNLFNDLYEANGYTYNYIYGGQLYVENFYFPMAGINFMAGINISL